MASDSVSVGKEVFENQGEIALDPVCSSQQGEEVELDWISELPDELLIDIVSRLTLVEAFRTSVLSSRWIDLWKSAVSVLDFDDSEELLALYNLPLAEFGKEFPERRRRYMNWVNGVVSQMQQSYSILTKFRVSFNLTKECNSKGDMDRWIEFAISKRVESLHLTLYAKGRDPRKYYVFSKKTLVGMRFLRSLHLSYVQVKGETLEYVIANCPVLEELVVKWAYRLKKLKVVGSSHSSLPLKHLEVTDCQPLESMEIDHAPHLGRLIFSCPIELKEIKVGDCPSLVDITVGPGFLYSSQVFRGLSGCAGGLVSLFLKGMQLREPISDAAEHRNLERLTIQVTPAGCLFWLMPLINVCPRLHTLRLLFPLRECPWLRGFESVNMVKVSRDSIKVVEIAGFLGYDIEYELMEYAIEYFVGLERIVIDSSTVSFFYDDTISSDAVYMFGSSKKERLEAEKLILWVQRQEAEKLVLELKSRAPPAVEFLVI